MSREHPRVGGDDPPNQSRSPGTTPRRLGPLRPPVEDSAGHAVAASDQRCLFSPATTGTQAKTGAPSPRQVAACLAGYDLHESVSYQPADHY